MEVSLVRREQVELRGGVGEEGLSLNRRTYWCYKSERAAQSEQSEERRKRIHDNQSERDCN